MSRGKEVFQQITGEQNPERAVQLLDSNDLAALIQELRDKRWLKSWIAQWVIKDALNVAVSRFLVSVELETLPKENNDD